MDLVKGGSREETKPLLVPFKEESTLSWTLHGIEVQEKEAVSTLVKLETDTDSLNFVSVENLKMLDRMNFTLFNFHWDTSSLA